MRTHHRGIQWLALVALSMLNLQTSTTFAQGTAFTYQGRLNDGQNPAHGLYDLQFTVYDALESGSTVGSPVTIGAAGVTNGLFTVMLDFGNGVFTGQPRWLGVAVRTNGIGAFTALAPRQPLSSSPYAILAGDVTTANIARLNLTGTTTPATGVPVIVNGFVVGATVTSGGSGYVTAPSVTLNNTGGGSNASITANISGGQVVSFTVLDAGFGYSPTTTLTIGSPPNNAYQVFGGANYFTGINQMNNPGNSFTGSFNGNGVGLTNVAGAMPWQVVAGTAVQAVGNTAYLLTNTQTVTLTLPGSPNVGDIIRVSGRGRGGWRIPQGPGQRVLTDGADKPCFYHVASSADGTKLVAGGGWCNPDYSGGASSVYTSSDSGATWTATTVPIGGQSVVASSANGTKLVAAVVSGDLYASTDSGATWTQPATIGSPCASMASSADGTKLVAGTSSYIYTSANSGGAWTQTTAPSSGWSSVASSADGTRLVAASSSGPICTSTNAGATWIQTSAPAISWASVASSADGTKLVAASATHPNGSIYTSTNAGTTWTQTSAPSTIYWASVASSADGARLVAVSFTGPIYTSTNFGASWSSVSLPQTGSFWYSVASSADGSSFVAVGHHNVYASVHPAQSLIQPATTSGTAGYLAGAQGAAVELQYIGNGIFYVLSCQGPAAGY